ncbi:MAG TPA: hypothetical protein VJL90_03965 [Pseudorhodoplanes sp.]|nr:hypothetical protein [Pseudorhodoplanes sp.]
MNHRLSYSMKLARPVVAALARPCVALAAAYALALQILLASVMAAGMAMTPGADGFICYGSGNTSDSGHQRPSHSPAGFADCALACVQGLNAGAILPPGISPALVSATGRPLQQIAAADVILSPRLSPKLAQGPPQIA